MRARVRGSRPFAAALLAGGLLGLVTLTPAMAVDGAPFNMADAVGDTVIDPVEEPITAPRADIVSIAARSGSDGIVLSVRLRQPADPKTDPNWASEDGLASYLTWTIDANGDGDGDFDVEYSVEPEEKTLLASLATSSGSFRPPADCDPAASFSPADGYTVVVDPKCLGNPASFSYQVEIFYNTDAKSDDAEIASDRSPDDGWAGPVAVTLPSGATAGTLPPGRTPTTPPASASAPVTATAPAAPGATPATPQHAPSGPRRSSSAPDGAVAPEVPDDAAAPAAPNLARTGPSDRVIRMTGFAVGVALVGVGLLVGNRQPSPRQIRARAPQPEASGA